MKPKIKKIEFLYQNQVKRRAIKVTLSNKHKVYIYPCHESWEQVGPYDDKFVTLPIAEKYNKWLHGIGGIE